MFEYKNVLYVKDEKLQIYEVIYKETKLIVTTEKNLSNKILKWIISFRKPLEKYIQSHPEFFTSLKPLTPDKSAPEIVKHMCNITTKVGVGPMASVAGTIAEYVGKKLLYSQKKVIIENGGDIFVYFDRPIVVGIYAGEHSPFSHKVKIKINLVNQPLGICTSSGTVGRSLSFGTADAVTVVSNSASFSDAVATATGNIVKTEKNLHKAVEFAKSFPETMFVSVIKNKSIAIWSRKDFCELV